LPFSIRLSSVLEVVLLLEEEEEIVVSIAIVRTGAINDATGEINEVEKGVSCIANFRSLRT